MAIGWRSVGCGAAAGKSSRPRSAGGAPTDWSADGRWIAHWRAGGVHLVSPDGATRRVLAGLDSRAFRFSRDGSRLLGVRRGPAGRWELTIWDVEAGRELRAVPLSRAPAADIQGMTRSSDEFRIIVGAGTATSDLWLLEQFTPS